MKHNYIYISLKILPVFYSLKTKSYSQISLKKKIDANVFYVILIIIGFFLVGILSCLIACSCLRYLLSSVNLQNLQVTPEAANLVNQVRHNQQRQHRHDVEQDDQHRHTFQGTNDSICPICLTGARFTVETNCGHKFCAECMHEYWMTCTNNTFNQNLKCPMCRQVVNCLLPLFTRNEVHSDDHNRIINHVNDYNRRFANDPQSLISRFNDLPILIRHLISEFFSNNGLSFLNRARVFLISALNFVYFVSPIDILPEALLGIFGYLDDILFALMTLVYLSIYYRQILQARTATR